jgi:hypothetical protein
MQLLMQTDQQQFSFGEWAAGKHGTSPILPKLPASIQTLWDHGQLTPGLRHALDVKQLRKRWLFRVLLLN